MLLTALTHRKTEVVEHLLQTYDHDSMDLKDLFIRKNISTDSLLVLLQHKVIDIDQGETHQDRAIFAICGHCDWEKAEMLVRFGLDLNRLDSSGRTLLDFVGGTYGRGHENYAYWWLVENGAKHLAELNLQ